VVQVNLKLFEKPSGASVASRGILEFHHFEVKNHLMPAFFEPYKEDIEKTSYGSEINKLTNSNELAKLYKALLNSIGSVS